ncbi:Alpha/Beta hydrolase protein [Phlyctochytrium arcticum]|nr:Alpha/Beta hydrolase protein [Phlyctochytrium arcticum]
MPFCTLPAEASGGPVQICYELHGSGPNKVLLIMGLSATLRSWDTTVEQLLARGGYEICIFDNRGIGHSTVPNPGYSIRNMAEDAYGLLQHLGWSKDVFLAGVSMGGMISQELILLAPAGTFAAVALISTHAGGTIPPLKTIWKLGPQILFPRERSIDENIDTFCDLVFAPRWVNAKPDNDPEFATNKERMFSVMRKVYAEKGLQTDKGRKGQMAAIKQHKVSPERLAQIGRLHIPIIVMTGTEDNLIRPNNSHHIARSINCPIEIFHGSGHGLAQEDVHRFHEVLTETFAKSKAFVQVAAPDVPGKAKQVEHADHHVSAPSL